jgi:hypothetical protein
MPRALLRDFINNTMPCLQARGSIMDVYSGNSLFHMETLKITVGFLLGVIAGLIGGFFLAGVAAPKPAEISALHDANQVAMPDVTPDVTPVVPQAAVNPFEDVVTNPLDSVVTNPYENVRVNPFQ